MPDLQVVFAIGAIAAAALASLMFGTNKTLRESNGDLRDRAGDLEKERDEERVRRTAAELENRTLRQIVTGEVQWAAIREMLDDHHQTALDHWKKGDAMDAKVLAAVKAISDRMNK